MKRFLISMLFSGFLSVLATIFSSEILAAPSVVIEPENPKAFESMIAKIDGCTPGGLVSLAIERQPTELSVKDPVGETLADNPGGNATIPIPGVKAGTYNVYVTCAGQPEEIFENKFTAEAIAADNLNIIIENNNTAQVTFKVEGCPANSEVIFDWKMLNRAGLVVDTGKYRVTADGSGMASHVFTFPGDHEAHIACGGIITQDEAFTVTGDPNDFRFPTNPPPLAPPCKTVVEGKCVGVETGIGEINTDGPGILYSMFVVILSLSGGVLVLLIMYAGYQLMTSRGNPEQIQKARELLMSAIIGFLFILFSYVILGILTDDILNIPGFQTGELPECLPNDPDCFGP